MASACQSEMKETAKTSDAIKAATLSSTVTALSSTVTALSSTVTALSSIVATLPSTVTALSSTVATLSSTVTALSSTVVAASSTAATTVTTLSSTVTFLSSTVATLSSTVTALSSTVVAASSTSATTVTALSSTVTALSSSVATLSSTVTALSSTVATLSSTVVAASSTAATLSSTSLQDLPIEILDDILMKAVIEEVMEKKLAKSAWIDYASRVIKSLRTVSSQWNYSLTTNCFETVLHRKLNNCKDPTAVTVELITESDCDDCFWGFGRLNDQIHILDSYPRDRDSDDCDDSVLRVYEGRDTTHQIKEILLPSVKHVGGMATCKRSNSIYVWCCDSTAWRSGPAVWRLVPDGDGGFEVLSWPTFLPSSDFLDCSRISEITVKDVSVLDDGNLLVLRHVFCEGDESHSIMSVHKPNGLGIRNVKLSHNTDLSNVAMKSNGNFVYAQLIDGGNSCGCIIREVDKDGNEIRNFQWLHKCGSNPGCKQLFLDVCDRVIFHNGYNNLIFLDSELNFLDEVEILEDDVPSDPFYVDFDKETNEMIVIYWVFVAFFLKLTL